jgi:hypothetical protein
MKNIKHNFVYVGIPRTGTSSIVNYFKGVLDLKLVGGKHDPIRIIKDTDGFFKFSFVRNPWDWCVSRFYRRMHCLTKQKVFYHKEFKDFILHTQRLRKRYPINRQNLIKIRKQHNEVREIIPQLYWITNPKGEIQMDFIGRFENLQNDFDTVMDKIGIERYTLPFKNVSKKKVHYSTYYDEETKAIVSDLYKEDIEYFDYKFEEE